LSSLQRLRARIEAWLALESRERAAIAAGLRSVAAPSELATFRQRFADLADPKLDDAIAEAQAQAEPGSPEARHLADLNAVRGRFRILDRRRELDAQAVTLRSALSAVVDQEPRSYLDLLALRRTTAERTTRAATDRALTRLAAEQLAPLARERFRITREALASLPAEQRPPTLLAGDGEPPDSGLAGEAESLLERTAARTRQLLPRLLERFSLVSLADARAHDLEPIRRAEILDRHFPPRGELEHARAVIERGLGLDLTAQGRIHLDLVARPGREIGVRAEAIRVPDEVQVVGRPLGGVLDAEALMGALGVALAFAHADRTLDLELRLLGDEAVSESFGVLFAGILHERAFGDPRVGADRELYYERAALLDLLAIRWTAARFPIERELLQPESSPARGATAAAVEAIDTRLARAAGSAFELPIDAALAWLDLDPDQTARTRLRAIALAAAIQKELRSSFGEGWFESRRAGRYLKDIWSYGRRYDAEELAREVGAPRLSLDLVLDELASSRA
jgi:hypothetical protein